MVFRSAGNGRVLDNLVTGPAARGEALQQMVALVPPAFPVVMKILRDAVGHLPGEISHSLEHVLQVHGRGIRLNPAVWFAGSRHRTSVFGGDASSRSSGKNAEPSAFRSSHQSQPEFGRVASSMISRKAWLSH